MSFNTDVLQHNELHYEQATRKKTGHAQGAPTW
jgi:hypothetical protein